MVLESSAAVGSTHEEEPVQSLQIALDEAQQALSELQAEYAAVREHSSEQEEELQLARECAAQEQDRLQGQYEAAREHGAERVREGQDQVLQLQMTLEQEREQFSEQEETLRQQLSELEDEHTLLREHTGNQDERYKKLEAVLIEQSQHHSEEMERWRSQAAQLQGHHGDCQVTPESSEQMVAAVEEGGLQREQTQQLRQQDLERLQSECDALRTALCEAPSKLEAKEQSVEDMHSQLLARGVKTGDEREQQCLRLQQALEDSQQRVTESEEVLRLVKDKARNAVQKLRDDLDASTLQVQDLQQRLLAAEIAPRNACVPSGHETVLPPANGAPGGNQEAQEQLLQKELWALEQEYATVTGSPTAQTTSPWTPSVKAESAWGGATEPAPAVAPARSNPYDGSLNGPPTESTWLEQAVAETCAPSQGAPPPSPGAPSVGLQFPADAFSPEGGADMRPDAPLAPLAGPNPEVTAAQLPEGLQRAAEVEEELRRVKEKAKAAIQKLRDDLDAALQDVEQWQRRAAEAEGQLAELSNCLAEAEKGAELLRNQLTQVKEKAKGAVQQLRDDLDAALLSGQQEQQRATAAEEHLTGCQSELNEALTAVEQWQRRAAEAEGQLAGLSTPAVDGADVPATESEGGTCGQPMSPQQADLLSVLPEEPLSGTGDKAQQPIQERHADLGVTEQAGEQLPQMATLAEQGLAKCTSEELLGQLSNAMSNGSGNRGPGQAAQILLLEEQLAQAQSEILTLTDSLDASLREAEQLRQRVATAEEQVRVLQATPVAITEPTTTSASEAGVEGPSPTEGASQPDALQLEHVLQVRSQLDDGMQREAALKDELQHVKTKAKAAVQKLRDDLDEALATGQPMEQRALAAEEQVQQLKEALTKLRLEHQNGSAGDWGMRVQLLEVCALFGLAPYLRTPDLSMP